MKKVLILDDNPGICRTLSGILTDEGYDVIVANNGKEGLRKMKENRPDVVLLDIKLPDIDGLSLIGEHPKATENSAIIVLTGYGSIESAVKSMKLGVFDYLTKPFNEDKILLTIKNAIETKMLRQKVNDLSERLYETCEIDFVMGNNPKVKEIFTLIRKVAPTNLTVLLQGESGVGKGAIARLLHNYSLRKEKPFIAVDCGTLPENLVESELFGYEKGAFTGADRKKLGQFELAEEGTLFLNEISNMPLSAQAKLLKVLQEREIQRLGADRTIKVDVRIIVDSNISLEEKVKRKEFREDLYHRINEFTIMIPPLRERGNDIFLLSEYFLEEANREFHKQVNPFSDEIKELFALYSWPGNIRELKSTIKRAVLLADETILTEHLSPVIQDLKKEKSSILQQQPSIKDKSELITSLKQAKKEASLEVEQKAIRRLLQKTKNNRSKVAKELGISRRALYYKLKKLGI
ncbi:MAG: sigma-54-dependent Fis family transcriptional regulator [Elusimicrobia bacterium]|nr:sigma-54-dependent Fis family transcriptional regulator [Elusimicrobiota bacterium]